MDNLTATLSVRIRQMRHVRQWTQEELADRVGLSARYIGDIERRQKSPTVSVLGRIAAAFQVDPCELLRKEPDTARQHR